MTGDMLSLLSREFSQLSLRLMPSLALLVYMRDRSPCIRVGSGSLCIHVGSFSLYTCGI